MRMKHKAYMTKRGVGQWIVGAWDSSVEMYREYGPYQYTIAREMVGRKNCTDHANCSHDHGDEVTQ